MDTARRFKPETILLLDRVAEHPEARRILGLFPSAAVRLVKHQRSPFSWDVSQSQALLIGKRTLMIGETSTFVGRFDGRLGSNVRCCAYHKLVPFFAGYADLIRETLTAVEPENITLGMLRLLPGHHRLATSAYGNRARERCGRNFVRGASDGKLRYHPKQRIEFYRFLVDTIRSFDSEVSISLCRETREMWRIFKNHCLPGRCNCVIW